MRGGRGSRGSRERMTTRDSRSPSGRARRGLGKGGRRRGRTGGPRLPPEIVSIISGGACRKQTRGAGNPTDLGGTRAYHQARAPLAAGTDLSRRCPTLTTRRWGWHMDVIDLLKRVIVTPAVYPRLLEFLHVDIQSTGQKSHCVNTREGHRNALF
ncbi:hypothetical protein P5V15_002995 [Pogonomyrmex californicus]